MPSFSAFWLAVIQRTSFALAVFILGIGMLFFTWLAFSLHYPLYQILDDLCFTLQQSLNKDQSLQTFISFSCLIFILPATEDNLDFFAKCLNTNRVEGFVDSVIIRTEAILVVLNNLTTQELNFTFDPTLNISGPIADRVDAAVNRTNSILLRVQEAINSVSSKTCGLLLMKFVRQ